MEEIKGYVSNIVYRNSDNAYTVFEVNSDGEEITCTGYPSAISEGESCIVQGEYVQHAVYGQQLKISVYQPCAPEDAQAVYRYLSSGAIKGIGETIASRIIKKFGNDTMRILDEEPERLAEVKGISERIAREIAMQVEEKRDVRDALIFLQQYGVTNKQAIKIWNTYGMQVYTVLKTDPYQLAEDIEGIGFARADEIARKAGIQADSDFRIRSGVLYILSEALTSGSSYLPEEVCVKEAATLLEVPEEPVRVQLQNLAMEQRIKIRMKHQVTQVYSNYAYYVEQAIATRLADIDMTPAKSYTEEEIRDRIRHIEEHEDIHLDDLQREAVFSAVERGVVLITGGPGTGKTTTINAIIRYFISDVKAVLLAAPTGRAAKRMSEATGYEAMTIHRLLGYKAMGDLGEQNGRVSSFQFERDGDNPLDADVVIIDEMSMVDIYLMNALLKAIKPGTRLVMVGDTNQLPSVGAGRVLKDIIDAGVFKTVELKKIFRQATQSDIVMNAHRILDGEPLVLDNKSKDFFFLERGDVNVVYKHMVQMMQDMLPGYVGCRQDEIQVLTPMRKGALGSIRLNEVLQSVLNPPAEGKAEYAAHDVTFRVGDKVMQTRNNYQMEWRVPGNFGMAIDQGTGIFNGDFGVIEAIDVKLSEMKIRFDDDRLVFYPFADLDDLEPAYAITVHKSQGSEYPAVILPLMSGPQSLFYRNLLYTAITRARKTVVILGSRQTLQSMIDNTHESTRYTGLCDRIHEVFHIVDENDGPDLPADLPGM